MLAGLSTKQLLKSLIEIPSFSDTSRISTFIARYLSANGISVRFVGNNLYCSVGKGKTILMNTHMDTVPPTKSWKLRPLKLIEKGGKLYGLGSADAKASLAAMLETMISLSKKDLDGRVIFAIDCDEETKMIGINKLLKKIHKFDAAIIGEPTELNIAVAQKGAPILKLVAKGKSAHASQMKVDNAIYNAMDDIKILQGLRFNKKHRLLGYPTIHTIIINSGEKTNVIPDRCEFILNVRSTPYYPNNYLVNLIKNRIKSRVEILSNRLITKETSTDAKIVRVAKLVNRNARITGFTATTAFTFINKPGIIIGPGNFAQAHQPDEFVKLAQVKAASKLYQNIVMNFFNN